METMTMLSIKLTMLLGLLVRCGSMVLRVSWREHSSVRVKAELTSSECEKIAHCIT